MTDLGRFFHFKFCHFIALSRRFWQFSILWQIGICQNSTHGRISNHLIWFIHCLYWFWCHPDSQIRTAQTRKKTIYLSLYWVVRWWRPAWPWWWWWRSSPEAEAVVRHPSRPQPPEARWWRFGCLGTPVLIAFTLNTHTRTKKNLSKNVYIKIFCQKKHQKRFKISGVNSVKPQSGLQSYLVF